MAKSLRSKWKRKVRADRKVKHSAREVARIKTLVENATEAELQSLANVKTVQAIRKKKVKITKSGDVLGDVEATVATPEEVATNPVKKISVGDVEMEDSAKHLESLKTEHGNYPAWMSGKKIRKLKRTAQKKVIGPYHKGKSAGKKRRH